MSLLGQWEIVIDQTTGNPLDTQQTAVHACLIYNPNSCKWKVLYFRAIDPEGAGIPVVKTKIWNPETPNNPISTQDVPDWPSWNIPPDPPPAPDDLHGRIFCGGHCFLDNGNLLLAGGHRTVPPNNPWARGMLFSYIFNPTTETWIYEGSSGNPVRTKDGRWYPTATLFHDPIINRGKVVASGGYRYNYGPQRYQLVFNDDMEIYTPAPNADWGDPIPNANNPYIANYPGVHVIPYGRFAGELFYSIPAQQSYRFNPAGEGSPNQFWNAVASSSVLREHGCSVLLPLFPNQTNARLMIIGGANENSIATNTCQIIELNSGSPAWAFTGNLNYKRHNANAVLLPDGNVLIVGGNEKGLYDLPVKWTEVYNPLTGIWTALVQQNYDRKYHSTAILLPDGRVWSAGSEGPASTNLEIYSPGYLFEGARPQFNSPPPANISYGSTFGINTDVPIESAVLIKPGSTTHAFDQDQRCISLTLSPPVINGGFGYTAMAPANGNIAPPGYYMLFVLRPKSASSSGQHKIPSVAKFVKLS